MRKDFKPFRTLRSRTVGGEKGIDKICQNAYCIEGNLKVQFQFCGWRVKERETDQGDNSLMEDSMFKKMGRFSAP